MSQKHFWKYNFVIDDWEYFMSCWQSAVRETWESMGSTCSDRMIVMSDEKPTARLSFI